MDDAAQVSDSRSPSPCFASPLPGATGQELPFGQVSCFSEKDLSPPLLWGQGGQAAAPGGKGRESAHAAYSVVSPGHRRPCRPLPPSLQVLHTPALTSPPVPDTCPLLLILGQKRCPGAGCAGVLSGGRAREQGLPLVLPPKQLYSVDVLGFQVNFHWKVEQTVSWL